MAKKNEDEVVDAGEERVAEVAAVEPAEDSDQTTVEAKRQFENETDAVPVRRDAAGALIIN